MKALVARFTAVWCLLVSPGLAFAGAAEASRAESTVTVGQSSITADSKVSYTGYVAGERIPVALEYSGTCNIVFNGLSLFRPIPFAPPRIVTGDIANVSGTPPKGRAASTGSVTFDLTFRTLKNAAVGTQSGLARLDLSLGVDADCDLATGDTDGVDRSTTIRVEIRVSTGPDDDD